MPIQQRLGREGRGVLIFECSMEWERGCILASCLGVMRRQLDQCVEYAKTRIAAYILKDCDVKVVVTERDLEPELVEALGSSAPRMLVLDAQASCPMEELLDQLQRPDRAPPVASISTSADDIAYILYTSGVDRESQGRRPLAWKRAELHRLVQ